MKYFKRPEDIQISDLPNKPYFVLVSADFGHMDTSAMYGLAEKLVASDAMWVAAHGDQGALFDNAVDDEYVWRNVSEDKSYPLVMTTWHGHESISDVMQLLLSFTPHEEWGDIDRWDTIAIGIQ